MAVKEYEAIKAEYDLEKACLGQMVKLESTLHAAMPLVQDVTMKLGIFASVWAAVSVALKSRVTCLLTAPDSDHGGHTQIEEFPLPCGRSDFEGD